MAEDIETVLDDIETFLKANLNTQIATLNSEKSDSITLADIGSDAYLLQKLNNQFSNFKQFIFYGLARTSAEGVGPATIRKLSFSVIIIVAEDENSQDIVKRMLRYGRVLKDLFEKNYNKISKRVIFKIDLMEPVSFKLKELTAEYNAVGVELTTTQG